MLTESQSITSSQGLQVSASPILEVQRDFSGNDPYISAPWDQAEGFADHLHHGGLQDLIPFLCWPDEA